MTRQQIQQAIETFRKITTANTISPENVGVLLRALLDFATSSEETAAAVSDTISELTLKALPGVNGAFLVLTKPDGSNACSAGAIPLCDEAKNTAGLIDATHQKLIHTNAEAIRDLAADQEKDTADLTKKISTADSKAASALLRAGTLLESKGKPGGLATLDEEGHLNPAQLPPDAVSVRVFSRFVEGVSVKDTGIAEVPEEAEVVYDTARRKFLLFVPGTFTAEYYDAWLGVADYMTVGEDGQCPLSERIYICPTRTGVWWWNGQELEDITASRLIQQKISQAATKAFDDLFLAAAGTYGTIDHTHTNPDGTPSPYYLNELWLTYEEAVAVYQAGAIDTQYCELRYYGLDIRTNLPPVCSSWAWGSTATKYQLCQFITKSNIEILNLTSRYFSFCIGPGGIGHVTFATDKLRKIIGNIDIGNYTGKNNHSLFGSCPELTEVVLLGLHSNLSLAGLPKINASSIRTLIERKYHIGSAATEAYTVTLHADVYNKIVEADQGDKASEWSGLLELAASKNITFASA